MARWYATSTQMLRDPKVVQVGERFGGDAVSVVHALLSEAMLQEQGGTVEYAFRNLAHDAFTERDKAVEIVAAFIDNGFMELESRDEVSITVTFPAWGRHQAAFRKAKSRASKPNGKANVTDSHEQVTPGHKKSPTRQDKTGEDKTGVTATSGKPSDFDSWLADYHEVTGKRSVTGSKPARREFNARVRDGYSLDALKAATRGCHSDEFCRTNGHDIPETILRASKVERYIALAAQGPRSVSAPGMAQAERRAEEIRLKREARAAA